MVDEVVGVGSELSMRVTMWWILLFMACVAVAEAGKRRDRGKVDTGNMYI